MSLRSAGGPPHHTQSPLQDSRLFGPRPWKILAATYETDGFLSNPDPGENLLSGNLVMETGCKVPLLPISRRTVCWREPCAGESGAPNIYLSIYISLSICIATTYETDGFLSNPDPGENLVLARDSLVHGEWRERAATLG